MNAVNLVKWPERRPKSAECKSIVVVVVGVTGVVTGVVGLFARRPLDESDGLAASRSITIIDDGQGGR